MIVSSILGGIDSLQSDDVIDATEGHQIVVGLVSTCACNGSGGQCCGFARLGCCVNGGRRLGEQIVLWGSDTACCGNRHQPITIHKKLINIKHNNFTTTTAADGIINKPKTYP